MKLILNKTKYLIVIFVSVFAFAKSGKSQCTGVVKEGIKKLAPYTHNGQVNNVTLVLGEPSTVHLSFYKGLNYKIQVCSQASAGKVHFRIIDENNAELFNSKNESEKDAKSWEFFSNSSQELVVELVTEDQNKQGCAAIVVGMQIPKSGGNKLRNL
jgi:hypothetical protein